jgi:hypothetical protein
MPRLIGNIRRSVEEAEVDKTAADRAGSRVSITGRMDQLGCVVESKIIQE